MPISGFRANLSNIMIVQNFVLSYNAHGCGVGAFPRLSVKQRGKASFPMASGQRHPLVPLG